MPEDRRRVTALNALHWLVLGFCWLAGQATAVEPGPGGRQLFRAYDENDGLRNLVVRHLLQSADGLLWVGTENGLYVYDGFRLSRTHATENLSDAFITGVAEDEQEHLWVSTGESLRVRMDDDRWIDVLQADAITSGALQAAPDGSVLLRSSQGLLRLRLLSDGGIERTVLPDVNTDIPADAPDEERQRPLHMDPSGMLWTGCGAAVCRIDSSGTLHRMGEREGVPRDRWVAWHSDRAGRLWVRSRTRLLVREPSFSSFHELALPPFALTADRRDPVLGSTVEGRLLTSGATGFAEWDGQRWTHHGHDDGLPAHPVIAMLNDQEGSLWLGTFGHGLYRALGFNAWRHWTVQDGLPSGLVWGIRRDGSGNVWTLTEDGATVMSSGETVMRRPVSPASGPIGQAFAMEIDTQGHSWIASRDGRLTRYEQPDRSPQSWSIGLSAQRMALLAPDQMWIAAETGLFHYDPMLERPEPQRVPGSEGIENPREILQMPDDSRWVVAYNGLFKQNGDRWDEVLSPEGERYEHFITGAVGSDGTLWLGTFGRGVWQLSVRGGQARVLQRLGEDTIGTLSVLFIRFDKRGWLWVGTDVGVSIYDGQRWHRLDRDDGLLWNDCDEGAFLADRDGSVWIGTSSGLSHFLRPETLTSPPLPTLLLRSLRVGSIDLLSHATRELPWQRADLSFELATASFSAERTVELRYRLHGLDDQWQVADSGQVRYPALPPGRYELELQAANPSRSQTAPSTRLAFTIEPPLWRTPLAYLLAVALLLVTVLLFVQLRLQLLLRRSRELERLVAQRTAELESDKLELLRTREALMERATRDALTGLWNRGVILEQLDEMLRAVAAGQPPLAVVLIDVDHFKRINDTHGHLVGDEVLRQLSRHLQKQLGENEVLGRYGGEELLLLIPALPTSVPNPRIEQLHQLLCNETLQVDGLNLQITASFGVAWSDTPGGSADALLQQADLALYQAKAAGRARVRYASWRAQRGF